MHYCFPTIVHSWVMRGKVSMAAMSTCHSVKAEELSVSPQPTVLRWACGAAGSSDHQSRPQRTASQFSCHTRRLVSSFSPRFLDSHPSLDGFQPRIACVFLFFFLPYIYLLTRVATLQIVSRPRGESRQVLSITSSCVGLR